MGAHASQLGPKDAPCGSRAAGVFVLRFLVLLTCFYAISATPWFQRSFMPGSLDWNAHAGSFLLRLLVEQTHVVGLSIVSPRFALTVFRGCDGIDPAALFVAAVLAFQAPWRSRLIGILGGVALLLMANCFRIISLYYVGALMPNLFDAAHIDIWQPLFVIVVALMFIAWAKLVCRSPVIPTPHAHR